MLRFRFFNTVFEVSYLLTAVMSLSVILSGKESLLPLCLLSAVVHESGHLLFLYKFGASPSRISLKLSDVRIVSDFTALSLNQELMVVAAGPLANLLLSAISFIMYWCFSVTLFLQLCITSLCIGIFNLLPVRTLDGEQMLSLLLLRKIDDKAGNLIINIVSIIIILPVATAGFLLLLSNKHNYTLLIVAAYLVFSVISKEMR